MLQDTSTQGLPVNWLSGDSVNLDGGALTISGNLIDYGQHWTQPVYWNTYTYLQKIRLKMSEVEKLRAAAKKDKALREVLEKFGPHIEVEVDFK